MTGELCDGCETGAKPPARFDRPALQRFELFNIFELTDHEYLVILSQVIEGVREFRPSALGSWLD